MIEHFTLSLYYISYLTYLICNVGCFWMLLSGEHDAFSSLSLLVVSMVGLSVCSLILLKRKEELRELSEVIIPKKLRRAWTRFHNRFFKEGFI